MAYNNNIPSYHDLRGLSIVWMRAIALAWEYLYQLKTEAKSKLGIDNAYTYLAKLIYDLNQLKHDLNDLKQELNDLKQELKNPRLPGSVRHELKKREHEDKKFEHADKEREQTELYELYKLLNCLPDPKAQRFLYLLLVENNLTEVLREYFNYQCPFSVDLKCALWVDATWTSTSAPTTEGNATVSNPGKWSGLAANEIFFHIPDNPNSSTTLNSSTTPSAMGNEAIALAAYLDSGSSYLFSCC